MNSISKKAITVITESYLAIDNNGQLVAISIDDKYQYTIQVDGFSDREKEIKTFQFTPYGLFHYIQDLRSSIEPQNGGNGGQDTSIECNQSDCFDELNESEIEANEYKQFVSEVEVKLLGCLYRIGLIGVLIMLIVMLLK